MRKTLAVCSALMIGVAIVFSCSLDGKMPDVNTRSGVVNNGALTVKYIYSRISYQEMLANWQDTKSIILGGR